MTFESGGGGADTARPTSPISPNPGSGWPAVYAGNRRAVVPPSDAPTLMMLLNMGTTKHGGTEEYLCEVARIHGRSGGRTVVALQSCSDPIRALLEDAGAAVEVLGEMDIGADFMRRATQVVRRHGVDVAVLNFFGLAQPVPLALRAAGTPHVIFVDDLSGDGRFRSRVHAFVGRARIGLNALACDRVVGVSDWVRRRDVTCYGVPEARTRTVYNGVHPGIATPEEGLALRDELGIPADAPVVLTVGQLIPEKGFDHLLVAVARLRAAYPDVRVVVVGGPGPGGGDFPERLRTEGHALLGPAAIFPGVRSDVRRFMAMADVVAVPSVWEEAFGFVVAEAMITGNALVASRVGGIPELVKEGVTGLLVPKADPDALSDALGRLLADPALRTRLGEVAMVEAKHRFSSRRMVTEMLALVDEVTGFQRPD